MCSSQLKSGIPAAAEDRVVRRAAKFAPAYDLFRRRADILAVRAVGVDKGVDIRAVHQMVGIIKAL